MLIVDLPHNGPIKIKHRDLEEIIYQSSEQKMVVTYREEREKNERENMKERKDEGLLTVPKAPFSAW